MLNPSIPLAGKTMNFLDTFGKGTMMGQRQQSNALAMDRQRQQLALGDMQVAHAGDKRRSDTFKRLARAVITSKNPAADYPRAIAAAKSMGATDDELKGLPDVWGPDAEMALRLYSADEKTAGAMAAKIKA